MAKQDLAGSTAYSAARYAHPFFLPVSPAARTPIDGMIRLTDWSKEQLGPVPPVKRGGRMDLADIIGAEGVHEIQQLGEIRFHALGDSGHGNAHDAERVADDMAGDYKPGADGLNPALLLHLGDVIYGVDKQHHYGERFYSPYRHYPGKIIAIPGNHDGEVRSPLDEPSLGAFLDNFCANTVAVAPQASASGIYRQTMTQPGVYWWLEAPFVRVVGLYSNRIENPGYLQGKTEAGALDTSQLDWLVESLRTIRGMADKKALIVATHHPPYSTGGHSGSRQMGESIDAACHEAGIIPDAFLSAHAHSYQRYTRRINGRQVPYIVAGTGGMPPQSVPVATGEPIDGSKQVTYDKAMASLGYLFITASTGKLQFEFWPRTNPQGGAFDPISVDLATHTIG